jgi:Lipopolysaccharide-assembly
MKRTKLILFGMFAILLFQGSYCKFPYSFKGGRKELNDSVTVSVMAFVNSAPLAKATITQTMTEALKDALQRQTRMQLVTRDGKLNYEGKIVGYAVTPVAVQSGGGNQSTMNRLTITISMKYEDGVDDHFSFENNFSRFSDFSTSQNLTAVEDALIKDITDQLVQDIMNRSVNAW